MGLLDQSARAALLQRARCAIAGAIGIGTRGPSWDSRGDLQPAAPAALRAGAFVTLRLGGRLRGCIGYLEPDLLLFEVVEQCAVSAALSDPRFPPLTAGEWSAVEVEISVLGPIERVADISEVEVGRHGLIAELGRRRGLLLPQVATEWQWGAAEFASQTCVKAGLPMDAWRNGASLYRFEAEVFGEKNLEGR